MEGRGGEVSRCEETILEEEEEAHNAGDLRDETSLNRPETPLSSHLRTVSHTEPRTPQRGTESFDQSAPPSAGYQDTVTPSSTTSRINLTPQSAIQTTITSPSTARSVVTDLSNEKGDKIPAYRREAPIFSNEDSSVRRKPCLQCAIAGLECDMIWPTCSRCLRRQDTVKIQPATSRYEERRMQEPCLARRRLLFEERSDVFSAGIYYTTESVLARLVDDALDKWAEKLALEQAKLERLLGQGREPWSRSGMRYLSTFAMFNYPPQRRGEDRREFSPGIGALGFAPRRPVNPSEIRPDRLKSTDMMGP